MRGWARESSDGCMPHVRRKWWRWGESQRLSGDEGLLMTGWLSYGRGQAALRPGSSRAGAWMGEGKEVEVEGASKAGDEGKLHSRRVVVNCHTSIAASHRYFEVLDDSCHVPVLAPASPSSGIYHPAGQHWPAGRHASARRPRASVPKRSYCICGVLE